MLINLQFQTHINIRPWNMLCGLTSQRCRTTSKSLDLVDHFDSLALNAFLGLSACVVDIHFQGLSHGHFSPLSKDCPAVLSSWI